MFTYLLFFYFLYSKILRHHNYFSHSKLWGHHGSGFHLNYNGTLIKEHRLPKNFAHEKQKNVTYNDAALVPKNHQNNRTLIWKNKNPHFL